MITQSKIGTAVYAEFRRRQYADSGHKRLGIFHVTDYNNSCRRNAYYKHLAIPQEQMNTKSMSILFAGEAMHQLLDKQAPQGGGETRLAYNIVDDCKADIWNGNASKFTQQDWLKIVVGECDALYDVTIEGKPQKIIVDYKTWLSKGYKKRAVDPDYKEQTNIYKYLLEKDKGIKVDYGAIIYLDFAERGEKPIIFGYKLDDINQIHARLLATQVQFAQAASTGILPDRVGEEGRWKCDGYCSFAKRCFNESKLSKEENKLVVNV